MPVARVTSTADGLDERLPEATRHDVVEDRIHRAADEVQHACTHDRVHTAVGEYAAVLYTGDFYTPAEGRRSPTRHGLWQLLPDKVATPPPRESSNTGG